MSVVISLLRAIDRADGDALVMHVGEKPYVVTAGGHAELAANALTVPAMTGMLDQLLPAESRKALNELGAVEYHLPPDQASPGTQYSVVAARGGNDIWIEVRRRKTSGQPAPAATPQTAVAVEEPPPPAPEPRVEYDRASVDRFEPPVRVEEPEPAAYAPIEPFDESGTAAGGEARSEAPTPGIDRSAASEDASRETLDVPAAPEEPGFELTMPGDEDFFAGSADTDLDEPAAFEDLPAFDFTQEPEPAPAAAVVVPMARVNVRLAGRSAHEAAAAPAQAGAHRDPLHHLLHVAAGRGASALYVAPQAKPSLRVDGEIRVLDEAPLSQEELERGVRGLLGTAEGASLPIGEIETREVDEVGRVQYLGFRDHRGLGAMFRMLPGRAISSEQFGLSGAIQALCTEPEGLLLVAGSRGAGKSTLVASLVDQINQTRRDHVISVESEIQYVHANRTSFISQREARDEQQFADAVRGALREAPDVLVVDGVMNAEIAAMALHAAAEGHLVVASLTAAGTTAALERFVGFFGHDATAARGLLSEHLRGLMLQALLRKTGGGRAAAREVLVNVPSVASLVAGGDFDQIPSVINSGRRVGMVPLNDALLGLVQNGALDVRQAYRKSPDQRELLDMLTKAGFDTTFAENLR